MTAFVSAPLLSEPFMEYLTMVTTGNVICYHKKRLIDFLFINSFKNFYCPCT